MEVSRTSKSPLFSPTPFQPFQKQLFRKMKKLAYIALVLVSLLSACTANFEEINSNPNAPESVPGSLLLPTLIIEPAQMQGNLGWEDGNISMQIVAVNNFTTFDQMGWGGQSGVWNLLYRGIRDAQNLIDIAEESGNADYKAVALIIRAWMGGMLTDMFGDVPFSEANKAKDGNFTPSYDNQEDVYTAILADLEEAADLLGTGSGISGDLLYSGNLDQWRKFANSLRIRYLMRLENKWGGSTVGAQIQQIIDSEPVFETVEDGASVPYLATAPNQSPRHTGRVGGFDEQRLSQKAEERMKAIDDPRLFVYYRPIGNPDSLAAYFDANTLAQIEAASGTGKTAYKDFFTGLYAEGPEAVRAYYPLFKGLPNGLSEGNAINYNGSRQNQSRLGEILRELPNGVSMHFMTYAELQFILAEAAQKGYISGDAEVYYLAGIQAAMDMYGITPHESYYTQEGVALSDDSETALDQIAVQKWMSLFVAGFEAYFDWRRTGRPAIEPGPDNLNANRVPLRFVYPDDEQALNSANWSTAVERLGGQDEINAVMWLLED